jgi:hypothetical protein
MTVLKLETTALPKKALDHVATQLWHQLGSHHVAIVELQVIDRTEAADADDHPLARLRIVGLELAVDDRDDENLRQAMARLHAARTATGTLDEALPGTDIPDVELVAR